MKLTRGHRHDIQQSILCANCINLKQVLVSPNGYPQNNNSPCVFFYGCSLGLMPNDKDMKGLYGYSMDGIPHITYCEGHRRK